MGQIASVGCSLRPNIPKLKIDPGQLACLVKTRAQCVLDQGHLVSWPCTDVALV